MTYPVLYILIVGLSITLTLFKPRFGFLFLIFLLPLSHQGLMIGLVGYEYPHQLPLLLTVATFTSTIVLFFKDVDFLTRTIRSELPLLFPFCFFFGLAVITNYYYNGFTFSVALLDLFAGPICLFVISCAVLNRYPSIGHTSSQIIIMITIIGFLYGCFEYLTGLNPILHEYLATIYPPIPLNIPGERVSSFFGHYLCTSLYYLFSMIICFRFVRNWYGFFLGLIFYCGVLMTQSRVGAVLGLIMFVYNYLFLISDRQMGISNKEFKLFRSAFVGIPVIFLLAVLFFDSQLFDRITERFLFASIEERVAGLRSFQLASIFGHGADASNQISKSLGSDSGLENPWAYLAYDYGILALIFYCVALGIVLLPVKLLPYKAYCTVEGRHLKVFFFIIIIAASSFTSFGNRSNINYLIWFLASLVRVYGSVGQKNYLGKKPLTEKLYISE